jgi:hexosaminidase
MAVVETLVDEITTIFPSRFIHLGGDEVSSAAWLDAYLCPDLIRAEGLAGVDDLPAWFSKRLEDMLRARGRILVGWDDVQEHERPTQPNTTLSDAFTTMHWRRRYTPANLLDRDVIQAMDDPYYLDLDVPLYNTYAYEPVPDDATSSQAAHVLGVQASMWTNKYRTQADVDGRVFPRLAALAEVGWTPSKRKDWPSFLARWQGHAQRLELLGVVGQGSSS